MTPKAIRLLASHAATAVAERGDWAPWSCCDVCHQRLKGPALLAMGRACWKLYAPLADDDERRCRALTVLGLALAATLKQKAQKMPASGPNDVKKAANDTQARIIIFHVHCHLPP